jgi:hypothetical protein
VAAPALEQGFFQLWAGAGCAAHVIKSAPSPHWAVSASRKKPLWHCVQLDTSVELAWAHDVIRRTRHSVQTCFGTLPPLCELTGRHFPSVQTWLSQSVAFAHLLSVRHRLQVPPPQSMSDSLPFWTLSVHVGCGSVYELY